MKKVLIGAVVAVLLLVVVIATRPDAYRVERSVTVKAPVALAHEYLSDFHHWGEWSPWDKLDPKMEKKYTGAEKGIGATYAWTGNDKVGSGEMKITGVRPNELIKIDLHFIKPFESKNETSFITEAKGEETTVRWVMDGHNDLMGKAMSLFMNMDKMIGPDFEKGLASLKPILETAATKAAEEKLALEKAAAEKAAAEKAAAEAAEAAAAEEAAHAKKKK